MTPGAVFGFIGALALIIWGVAELNKKNRGAGYYVLLLVAPLIGIIVALSLDKLPPNDGASTSAPSTPTPAPGKPASTSSTSLYDEMKTKCAPTQFMKPYDHDKVACATDLYDRILKAKDNEMELRALRTLATEQLGIKFSSQQLYSELLEMTDPKHFMNPFDAQKVRVANDYHKQVHDNADDVDALERIKDELTAHPQFKPQQSAAANGSANDYESTFTDDLVRAFVVIVITSGILLTFFFLAWQQ